MEKAASSYAKYNRVDKEDEQAIPYDRIVIQPFTAFVSYQNTHDSRTIHALFIHDSRIILT